MRNFCLIPRVHQRRRQQFGVGGARLRTGSAHLCSYDTCTRVRYAICYLHGTRAYIHVYSSIVVARFETRVHAAAAATHISASYLLFYWGGEAPLLEYWGGDRPPCPPSAAAPVHNHLTDWSCDQIPLSEGETDLTALLHVV